MQKNTESYLDKLKTNVEESQDRITELLTQEHNLTQTIIEKKYEIEALNTRVIFIHEARAFTSEEPTISRKVKKL